MNPTDIVTMLGNLSQSMGPLQHLISGFTYLLGLFFIMNAVIKLKSMASPKSKQKHSETWVYFTVGTLLLFLPSTINDLSNTVFGSGSALEEGSGIHIDIQSAMTLIIKTVGMIWFVRGCVLLTHAGGPEDNHATKGMTFIAAGILAMNFQATIDALTYIMHGLMNL